MDNSREAFANNHLITYAKLESLEGKPHSAECRYDRYPGKVERIQLLSELSYARKKGKKWIDQMIGENRENRKKTSKSHNSIIGSLMSISRWRKKSLRRATRGRVPLSSGWLMRRRPGTEMRNFFLEQGRENQTGVNYPRFTFLKYKNSKPEDAILYKFSGPIYTPGGKVQLNVQYGLMIAVKMEMVTPTPPASDKNASNEKAAEPTMEKSASLPPPVSDKIYTFQQIEKQKAELKDKVVRIEIMYLLGEPSDLLGNGTQRYIVKDTSKGATPYGQVAFPREGLEKMGLANDPHRQGPFILYARVHVFPEKKADAICVAIGTHVAVENGKATYSWRQ
jgi:hypothetical protein